MERTSPVDRKGESKATFRYDDGSEDVLNYERDTTLDHQALDVEWLRQADLGRRYGKMLAHLRRVERRAHERVKTVRSDLIHEANTNPKEVTGKSKPNAQDIEAYYRRHKDYKAAKEAWIEAQYEADYADIARWEVAVTRKAALENLVVLHGQGFFAGPRVPRNLDQEVKADKKRREANARVVVKGRKKN